MGQVQPALSHTVPFPSFPMRQEEGDAAEVSSQPRPSRRTTCLLTSPDFSAVRNPSNLSCQTEAYKKLTHTVILRDAITMSLPGGLCWNSPGSHALWLPRVKRRQRATRLCRGGGCIFTMRGASPPQLCLSLSSFAPRTSWESLCGQESHVELHFPPRSQGSWQFLLAQL